jgi:hypothetical protein
VVRLLAQQALPRIREGELTRLSPTAEEWVQQGRGLALPADLSAGFDRYINSLPWVGMGLDWSKMPRSEIINIAKSSEQELLAWARRTRVGAHGHIVVWYSLEEGGLVVPLELGLVSLDELYLGTPGIRFAFGIDLDDGGMKAAFGDLLQYGSGDKLIAVGA